MKKPEKENFQCEAPILDNIIFVLFKILQSYNLYINIYFKTAIICFNVLLAAKAALYLGL